MKIQLERVASCFKRAFSPACRSALWLLKMMLPIMLLMALLDYYGVVAFVSQYTEPLFRLLGLSGEAAFVFITSSLTSIYSAIGVIALFGFDYRAVTILASMCLIAHNLIIEGAIQKRSGSSFMGITLLRIGASLLCGYLLNLILPKDMAGTLFLGDVEASPSSLLEVFEVWLLASVKLTLKVVVIIYLLNVFQALLKEYKIIDLIEKPFRPLMALLGLPESTTFLWIVANTLGLAYGGMVIVEEVKKGELKPKDVSLLNTSISQMHSLLEDTMLFISVGVWIWWAILPRAVFAIVLVWMQRGIRYLRLHL